MRTKLIKVVALALCCCSPFAASAFHASSPIHHDCHERLTFASIQRATALPGFPATVTAEDRVLAHALQFDVGPYGKDRYTISLMLGVRYNDLHGAQAIQVGELAPVHNEERYQDQHCLRLADQDGSAGAAEAVDACRRFIRERVALALGDNERPDPLPREEVEVYLRFRGKAPVALSRLYFQLGRAIHAVQDSFSHTLRRRRAEGGSGIIEVANWMDEQSGHFVVGRDGVKHVSAMDNCSCRSVAYDALIEDTKQAVVEFLDAVLLARGRADRDARIDGFFAKWMAFESGCTVDNNYCDHLLLAEVERDALSCTSALGCQLVDARGDGMSSLFAFWPLAALILVGLIALPLIRRRKVLMLLPLVLSAPRTVAATPAVHCQAPEAAAGLYAVIRGGVSSDNPALAFEGSALYRGERFGAGLALEYNPFLSVDRGLEATAGTFNISAMGSLHLQISHRISLRFELRVGLAVLLFDTPGYETGDVGVNIGMRALGFDIRVGEHLFLMLDPIDLSMPVFSLDKLPFYYRQWRIGAGLAWRF